MLNRVNESYTQIPVVATSKKNVNFEKTIESKLDVIMTSAENWKDISVQLDCIFFRSLEQGSQNIKSFSTLISNLDVKTPISSANLF